MENNVSNLGLKNNSKFLKKIFFPALFPNIIIVLGEIINVFVQGVLVGQKIGDYGLQAVNQTLPIYLILCTIGSLFAAGSSYLSSIRFGKKDKIGAQRVFGSVLWILFLISAIVCVVGYFVSPWIAILISTEQTYERVLTLTKLIFVGGVFKTMLYISYFYLRLEGKNLKLMFSMLIMTIFNIVFGYIFMFVLNFGIEGAGWASVVSTGVGCIISYIFLFTGKTNFKFKLSLPIRKDIKGIFKFGSPIALDNILSAIEILAINLILESTGIVSLLTIFAVVSNVSELSMCVQEGVPQTASSMTSVLRGERDSNSVKKLLNIQLLTGLVLSTIFAILFSSCSLPIASLFGSEIDCTVAIICFSASLIFATFNNTMSYYYNATSRTKLSNIIICCRIGISIFGFLIFANILKENVWVVFLITEVSTSIIFLCCGLIVSRKPNISKFYLLDESFEKSGKDISFTVECDNNQICDASEKILRFCSENGFEKKKANIVSLAIEEMLTIISQKSLMGSGTIDVRVMISNEKGLIRIRSSGKQYNPFEIMDETLDYMGVKMISKLATNIEYLSVLKVNTLIISI